MMLCKQLLMSLIMVFVILPLAIEANSNMNDVMQEIQFLLEISNENIETRFLNKLKSFEILSGLKEDIETIQDQYQHMEEQLQAKSDGLLRNIATLNDRLQAIRNIKLEFSNKERDMKTIYDQLAKFEQNLDKLMGAFESSRLSEGTYGVPTTISDAHMKVQMLTTKIDELQTETSRWAQSYNDIKESPALDTLNKVSQLTGVISPQLFNFKGCSKMASSMLNTCERIGTAYIKNKMSEIENRGLVSNTTKLVTCEHLKRENYSDTTKPIYLNYGNTTKGTQLFNRKLYDRSCKFENDGGGAWTIIQNRIQKAKPEFQESFDRSWDEYKEGFGTLNDENGEFWFGNEFVHQITWDNIYELRVDFATDYGNITISYESFKVKGEQNDYAIEIGGARELDSDPCDQEYDGIDDISDGLIFHNYARFGTKNRNSISEGSNGPKNCPKDHSSGWWFKGCHVVNLNGDFTANREAAYGETEKGVVWCPYIGITKTRMMIRLNTKSENNVA